MMRRQVAPVVAFLLLAIRGAVPTFAAPQPDIALVTLPSPESPLVSVRAMFRAGSILDPPGKEGLSALTALMVGASGTASREYSDLVNAFYPMAANVGVITDREVVVFSTQVHRDTLAAFTPLFEEVLLHPGFRKDDFTRNRDQLNAFLTTTLRSANDELLGLEMIQQVVFKEHPYGHSPAGTVAGLAAIALEDVQTFYREHYTRANLILGVGGGFEASYPARLQKALSALPPGTPERLPLPAPAPVKGRQFTLVDKQAESTGIHLGYPLPITRADKDFYALLVANSYLGEHRTFHGRLMQELRGKRGLNYGDYSYLEYWDNAPGTSTPPPNHPRRQQYFSIWVRPVVPANATFALRAAIAEVDRLISQGLTVEEFDLARDFLVSYSKLWARSLTDRLGFHMDSRFYGMPYFIDQVEQQLAGMTADTVNRAIRKYIQTENFQAVMITGNAPALREQLNDGRASLIEYASAVPAEVREADKALAILPIRPVNVRILPIREAFEGKRDGQ
jgi:zinc protease